MRIVLLMAGVGERLAPFTLDNHKSLVLLSGKPLLAHLMERFIENGQRRFVAIVGHQREKVVEFIEAAYGEKIELTTVDNPKYDRKRPLTDVFTRDPKAWLQKSKHIHAVTRTAPPAKSDGKPKMNGPSPRKEESTFSSPMK